VSEIVGAEELQRNIEKLAEEVGREMADVLQAGGQLVRSTAIKSIQEKSPGEAVTRSRNGGGSYTHTASKEGAAPNTDTGRLVSSVQVETRQGFVYVGSTLDYAGFLENGTRYMGERPWLIPALESRRNDILKLAREGVARVEKRNQEL
jgi:HK97 gp10 family phage protein